MESARGASQNVHKIVATLIALTSVLGAFAAWRASVAGSAATGAERKGFADDAAAKIAHGNTLTSVDRNFRYFVRAEAYKSIAETLGEQAGRATGDDKGQLEDDAYAYEQLEDITRAAVEGDAINPDGTLNLERKFEIEYGLAASQQDLDSSSDYAEADALHRKGERLVGLTALLIAAAFFLTLAEVSKTRAYRFYFVGGVVVLAASTFLLFRVELA